MRSAAMQCSLRNLGFRQSAIEARSHNAAFGDGDAANAKNAKGVVGE